MSEMKPVALLIDGEPMLEHEVRSTENESRNDLLARAIPLFDRPALTAEQVREIAEAAELINAIADWERKNGAAGHLVDDNERYELSEIVSAWAVNNAARKVGPTLTAIKEALARGVRG